LFAKELSQRPLSQWPQIQPKWPISPQKTALDAQRAIQRKPKLKEAAKADYRSLASFVRHALRKRHNSSATKV